jgi:hypothetical protein
MSTIGRPLNLPKKLKAWNQELLPGTARSAFVN